MAESTDLSDQPDAPPADESAPPPTPEPETASAPRWPSWAWPGLAAAAILGLLISNLFLVLQVSETNDEVAELRGSLGAIDQRLAIVADEAGATAAGIGAVLGVLGDLDARLGAIETPEPASPDDSPIIGGLPPLADDPENDPAIGMVLTTLSGTEYYLGQEIGFDLQDGRARAVLVWAHWCPFCQEEIPVVSDWIRQNAAGLDNFEIISITTAIDEDRPNPLIPYLDAGQFPFPVLIDDTGDMATRLGVDALPFWIFIGPDGAVLGRLSGQIGISQLAELFGQMDDLAAAG